MSGTISIDNTTIVVNSSNAVAVNPNLTLNSLTLNSGGTIKPDTGGAGGILGRTYSVPATGMIGETLSASATTVSLTSGTLTELASLTLTVGYFLLGFQIALFPSSGCVISNVLTEGVQNGNTVIFQDYKGITFNAGATQSWYTYLGPYSDLAPSSVQFYVNAAFAGGTCTSSISIFATRFA